MFARNSITSIHLPDATGTPDAPEEFAYTTRARITSPGAVMRNARMRLAARPNDGEPLSHLNRGQAGRKW